MTSRQGKLRDTSVFHPSHQTEMIVLVAGAFNTWLSNRIGKGEGRMRCEVWYGFQMRYGMDFR
ncbi:MAG TPA: hypothetical protein VE732_04065 [Nitrososphaera sp.]|nr:hypothetical protein [Nitrososphaera sp.]